MIVRTRIVCGAYARRAPTRADASENNNNRSARVRRTRNTRDRLASMVRRFLVLLLFYSRARSSERRKCVFFCFCLSVFLFFFFYHAYASRPAQ